MIIFRNLNHFCLSLHHKYFELAFSVILLLEYSNWYWTYSQYCFWFLLSALYAVLVCYTVYSCVWKSCVFKVFFPFALCWLVRTGVVLSWKNCFLSLCMIKMTLNLLLFRYSDIEIKDSIPQRGVYASHYRFTLVQGSPICCVTHVSSPHFLINQSYTHMALIRKLKGEICITAWSETSN